MKQMIVCIASLMLGIAIAGYVGGDNDNTLKSGLSGVWQHEIEIQNTYP